LQTFFCQGWPRTTILQISASKGARIPGVSHHTQLQTLNFDEVQFANFSCFLLSSVLLVSYLTSFI
jgi:hypothetical protein